MKYIYTTGAVLLLIAALLSRLNTAILPIYDPDITGYLGPAITWLKHHSIENIQNRTYPYQVFVLFILGVTESFKALVVAQHLLGLMSILLFWHLAFMFLNTSGFKNVVTYLLAFVLLLHYSTQPATVLQEKMIRPEAIYPFFIGLFLLLMQQFFTTKTRTVFIFHVLIIFNLLMYLIIPRWGFATVFVWLVLAIGFYIKFRNTWFVTKHALLSTITAYCLVIIPQHWLTNTYQPDAELFLPKQLFYVHAPEITSYLGHHNSADGVSETKTIQAIYRELYNSLHLAKAETSILGFNPDQLEYGETGRVIDSLILEQDTWKKIRSHQLIIGRQLKKPAEIGAQEQKDIKERTSFMIAAYNDILKGTLKQCYKTYCYKVVKQIRGYYCRAGYNEAPQLTFSNISLYTAIHSNLDCFQDFDLYRSQIAEYEYYPIYSLFAKALPYFNKGIQQCFLTVLVLSLLTLFFLPASWCLYMFITNGLLFSLVLTVAAIHTFDYGRYINTIHPIAMAVFLVNSCAVLHGVNEVLKKLGISIIPKPM